MITKNLSSFLNHISYVRGDNLRYLCFFWSGIALCWCSMSTVYCPSDTAVKNLVLDAVMNLH